MAERLPIQKELEQPMIAASDVDAEVTPPPSLLQRLGLARGSLWGTVFNTCAATLGAGALSLPHAMAELGVIPGLVLLVATALATHYSIVLLVAAITVRPLPRPPSGPPHPTPAFSTPPRGAGDGRALV